MKNIDQLKRCTDIKELEFYLDYNKMIEDMMKKRGISVDQLLLENKQIQQRIEELSENK